MYQQKRSGFNKGFYRRRGHRGRGSTRGDRRRKGFRRPFGSQGFRQRTSVHPYTEPQREQENESLMKVKIESVDASTLLKPMSIEKSGLNMKYNNFYKSCSAYCTWTAKYCWNPS